MPMVKYGFYSEKASLTYGTTIWETTEGKEVEITTTSISPGGEDYHWPDKVCVGSVVQAIRPGKASNIQTRK